MDRRLIVLAAGMFAIGTDSFVVAGILPNVSKSLGVSVGVAGQMVTVYALSYALLSPVIAATATGASLVPPEKRARALAIVIAGLSSATALGAPMGTFLGGLGDWRTTMWFVTIVGMAASVAVYLMLPSIPALPTVTLRQRLAPLKDSRVAMTLLTTLVSYSGFFAVYTYVGVSFDRATGGQQI